MLLTQTILLSLALGISAHHVRDGHFARGGRFGSGGKGGSGVGGSGSTGQTTTASIAVAASSTTAEAAASSSVSSTSGSSVAAGVGNSSTVAASGSSGDNSAGASSGATLLAANIQAASDSTGSADAEAGQSDSATDPDNFINFCSGKNVTDGFQVVTGSCNGIVMGDIPSSENMISSIITNPAPGQTLASNTEFDITVQVTNLDAGTFTNPLLTYYAAPQALSGGGIVIGHTHVTIQSLGDSLVTSTPPDPQTFAFFKGINDAGNGQGLLSATVATGLPAGAYRVCTMTSAANHQPVLMPVAQRGAQDDCTKFIVSDSGASAATTAAAVDTAAATSVAAAGAAATSAAAVSGSNSTVSAGSTNGGGSSGSNSRGGSKNNGRFARRAFIA